MSPQLSIDVIGFAVALVDQLKPGSLLEDVPVDGGRLEPGRQPPCVLLKEGGDIHERGVGMLNPARVRATAYGVDAHQASQLYRELVALVHRAGPTVIAVDGIRVGLFRAFDETGPQPLTDPDTRWDAAFGVIDLHLADRPVA